MGRLEYYGSVASVKGGLRKSIGDIKSTRIEGDVWAGVDT